MSININIAVIGSPNVGKTTLINAIFGDYAKNPSILKPRVFKPLDNEDINYHIHDRYQNKWIGDDLHTMDVIIYVTTLDNDDESVLQTLKETIDKSKNNAIIIPVMNKCENLLYIKDFSITMGRRNRILSRMMNTYLEYCLIVADLSFIYMLIKDKSLTIEQLHRVGIYEHGKKWRNIKNDVNIIKPDASSLKVTGYEYFMKQLNNVCKSKIITLIENKIENIYQVFHSENEIDEMKKNLKKLFDNYFSEEIKYLLNQKDSHDIMGETAINYNTFEDICHTVLTKIKRYEKCCELIEELEKKFSRSIVNIKIIKDHMSFLYEYYCEINKHSLLMYKFDDLYHSHFRVMRLIKFINDNSNINMTEFIGMIFERIMGIQCNFVENHLNVENNKYFAEYMNEMDVNKENIVSLAKSFLNKENYNSLITSLLRQYLFNLNDQSNKSIVCYLTSQMFE